jgi:hypothetical protein
MLDPEFTLAVSKGNQKVRAHFQGRMHGIKVASGGPTPAIVPLRSPDVIIG